MAMTAEQQLIIARLDSLSKDIELVRKEQELGKDKVGAASPWYVKWAGILGVPALVFVMMVNWSQANLNSGSTEKTQAETQKIRVDTLKTRADLQQQLDTLQKSRAADINTPGLNETLANIKSTIADIQRLRESEVKGALTNIVMRFVIVWFALQASGLAIGIFSRLWNTVFVSSFVLFNQTSGDRSIGKFIKTIALILIISLSSTRPLSHGMLRSSSFSPLASQSPMTRRLLSGGNSSLRT